MKGDEKSIGKQIEYKNEHIDAMSSRKTSLDVFCLLLRCPLVIN